MQRATILIGVPNSGKSTYAKKLVNKNTVMLDCDCIRMMLTGKEDKYDAFVKENEFFVWSAFNNILNNLIESNVDIIISNTNLNLKLLRDMVDKFLFVENYKIEFVDIETPVDVCIERLNGKNRHMVKVIKKMKENKEQIVNWIFENNYNYRIIETEIEEFEKLKAIYKDSKETIVRDCNNIKTREIKLIFLDNYYDYDKNKQEVKMEDKVCDMCKHKIENIEECEHNNRIWNNCVSYSKLKLIDEGENVIIANAVFSKEKPSIKIKLYRNIDFEEMLNFLYQSEWHKQMDVFYNKLNKESGLSFNFEEKIIQPIINKLHTLTSWYETKKILYFNIFESNDNEWCFIKEYFKLDWLHG